MSQRRPQGSGNPRGPKPSQVQKETLGAFLEKYPELARGRSQGPDGAKRACRLWKEIAGRLNVLGGAMKDYKGWRKYWNDKKGYLKKISAARRAHAAGTGGGPALPEVNLSQWDERMLNLMGQGFGEGDVEMAVPLFAFEEQEVPRPDPPQEHNEGRASPIHEVAEVPVMVHEPDPVVGVPQAVVPEYHVEEIIQNYDVIEDANEPAPALDVPNAADSEPDSPATPPPLPVAPRARRRRIARTAYADIHDLIVEREQGRAEIARLDREQRAEDARLGRELQAQQIQLMEEQNELIRVLIGTLERFHGQ